jgi:hypothetical protein
MIMFHDRHAKNKVICALLGILRGMSQENLFQTGLTTQPPAMEIGATVIWILRNASVLTGCPWKLGLYKFVDSHRWLSASTSKTHFQLGHQCYCDKVP